MSSKNILLFKRMLEDAEYDDIDVHTLLVTGIAITGSLTPLPFWQVDPEKDPKISAKMLWAGAKEAQAEVLHKDHSATPEMDKALWDITMEEVGTGTLVGPVSPKQVVDRVGALWVPSPRFGIEQNGKIRPIDDSSRYGINSAFGSGMRVAMRVWTRL